MIAEPALAALLPPLMSEPVGGDDPSLMTGALGFAVGLAELTAAGCPVTPGRAEAWFEHAVGLFNAGYGGRGLHQGLAGVGFAVVHAFPEHAELLEEIDEVLESRVRAASGPEVLVSLRNGVAGLLRYGVDRGPAGAGLIDAALSLLERTAVTDELGCFWPSPAEYLEGRGVPSTGGRRAADLGVAHGHAGLLQVLAAVSRRADFAQRALALMRPSVAWVLARVERFEGDFARLWVDGGPPHSLNFDTWCSGTPGAAFAMLEAAKAVEQGPRVQVLCDGVVSRILNGARPGLPKRVDLCCGLAGVAMSLQAHPFAREASRLVVEQLVLEMPTAVCGLGLQFGPLGVALTLARGAGPWRRAFSASLE